MPSPALADRARPIVAELGKFVVVGGVCFVLDTILAYVFRYRVGLGPTTSKALSTILATGLSYLGNRLWSFAHRTSGQEVRHARDASLFILINALGLIVTLIPVDISHYLLGQTGKVAFLVSSTLGTVIATVFRFYAYRRWVFPASPEEHALV